MFLQLGYCVLCSMGGQYRGQEGRLKSFGRESGVAYYLESAERGAVEVWGVARKLKPFCKLMCKFSRKRKCDVMLGLLAVH